MEIWNSPEANDLKFSGFAGHNIFTLHSQLFTLSTKKALRPNCFWDERPAFRGTTRIRILRYALSSGNGGTPVPLSGAAPGRTKRHSLNQAAQLRAAFSRRPPLSAICKPAIFPLCAFMLPIFIPYSGQNCKYKCAVKGPGEKIFQGREEISRGMQQNCGIMRL